MVVLEQRRQAIAHRRICGTQHQAPALALVKVGEFLLRLLHDLVALQAVTSQNLPRRGEPHMLGGPIKQSLTQGGFSLGTLDTHRRLRTEEH